MLRRKPFGQLLPSAHAVDREFRLLSALYPLEFPVPAPLALCDDPDVIGAIFYVMEVAKGRPYSNGALPDFDRADLRFQSDGARPSQRCQLEDLRRGQRLRAQARLLDERGESHFGKRVEPVVAGGAIRADSHVAAGGEHLRNRRHTAAKLQVGAGTVDDVGRLAGKARNAVLVHPNAMRQCSAGTRDSYGIEIGDLVVTGLAFD